MTRKNPAVVLKSSVRFAQLKVNDVEVQCPRRCAERLD